jgi:PRTRC genetic system protein A
VGYLVNRPSGITGERGAAYDYISAGNGIFIEAKSELLAARILVTPAVVRGLPELATEISLPFGKIPGRLFDLMLSVFLAKADVEVYVAIVRENGEYVIKVPEQTATGASIEYATVDNAVLDFHSHGLVPAFFSGQDNRDEQGFRLYGVVGNLDKEKAIVKIRVGVYGYFHPLKWSDVFSGSLYDCEEVETDDLPARETTGTL